MAEVLRDRILQMEDARRCDRHPRAVPHLDVAEVVIQWAQCEALAQEDRIALIATTQIMWVGLCRRHHEAQRCR